MTKHVRIENADTSPYKVVVQLWDKAYPVKQEDGTLITGPDTLVKEQTLDFPTAMAFEWITESRYIVIKEAK